MKNVRKRMINEVELGMTDHSLRVATIGQYCGG